MSYTYKAFGPSDSTAAFLAGASVAERAQQLRAQEAERRMRERHLAANAEMLAARAQEHYADIEQKKRAQVEYEAIKAASTEMFTEALKATGSADKAAAETYATLGVQYPSHAKDFAQAYADIKRGSTLGETTPHQKVLEQQGQARIGLAERKLAMPQRGMTIKTNPDGTTTIVQGPLGDELTTANKTKTQESQAASVDTLDIVNRLEPLISSNTVGVKAFAESWVKDRALGQFFPEMVNKDRVKAEQLVAELRTKVVNELGTPPISDRERKEILKSVPGINEPVDSPERARTLMKSIRRMSAMRALVKAEKLGGAVPRSAAMAMDDEELEDLVKRGLITPETAVQAYDLKRSKE